MLVAGDPEREHMRKVREDGGIRYHVNLLQAMVSIYKRLSAGKLVTDIKRGKTCNVWRARKNALKNLFGFALELFKSQLSALIGQTTSSLVAVIFQPKILEIYRRKSKANT